MNRNSGGADQSSAAEIRLQHDQHVRMNAGVRQQHHAGVADAHEHDRQHDGQLERREQPPMTLRHPPGAKALRHERIERKEQSRPEHHDGKEQRGPDTDAADDGGPKRPHEDGVDDAHEHPADLGQDDRPGKRHHGAKFEAHEDKYCRWCVPWPVWERRRPGWIYGLTSRRPITMAGLTAMEAAMKRALSCCAVLLIAALVTPALRADVKTTETSSVVFEGMLGAMMNRMSGASKGTTSTVSVKGNRMSRMTETTGQIVDLGEQKIYNVDVRKKEYTVMTFAQMREQMEKLKADMAKQQQSMDPEAKNAMAEAGKQMEFDVDVKPTGQQKAVAGQNAREFVLTITMRQQGMKIEESGGLVMTNNLWMAPRIAAMDELQEFNMKFIKAVYGDVLSGLNPQQGGPMSSMVPGLGSLMTRMATETQKLEGSPLASTMVIESVKSAEQMKNATTAKPSGGLGGMLAKRMGGGSSGSRARR